ncbi:Polysaccharide pyruvyl transferase [Paracoccus halophilus]|uniref:Polysaccharide pyruvyl transferase n=3 Tax=Paracoccus halophilus TaxID=376733 RepID=A0A1I0SWE9_9RHOB|nr:Polysaccharide pyruvyl transferase [Paracoccus halophilus]
MRIAAVTLRRATGAPIKTNTGNYMFTEAVYRNLDAQVEWVGFRFTPEAVNEKFDAVIVPAANWLNANSDFADLARRIEQLTIPVTCVGLGTQAPSLDSLEVDISPSALDLARVLSHKNASISLRGEFTRAVLARHGITNTVVTGCPSLYMDVAARSDDGANGGIVLQGTRYVMARPVLRRKLLDNDIFRIAGRGNYDIVYQSEKLEIAYLDGTGREGWEQAAHDSGLPQLYGFDSAPAMRDYLELRGRVFTNIDSWSDYLKTKTAVVGSRLHGAILALNSGVPALLLPHDSRTRELIDFAGIPTADPDTVLDVRNARVTLPGNLAEMVRAYRDRRARNKRIYQDFLAANGLAFRDSRPEHDRAGLLAVS